MTSFAFPPVHNSPQDLELASALMSMRRSTQCRSHPEYISPPVRSFSRRPDSPTRIDDDFACPHPYPSQILPSKPYWPQPRLPPPTRTMQTGPVQLPPLLDERHTQHHLEVSQSRQSPTSSFTSQPVLTPYTPEQRREAVRRFKQKKLRRKNQSSAIRYQVRKRLADTRPRFRGRFYKPKPSMEENRDENLK